MQMKQPAFMSKLCPVTSGNLYMQRSKYNISILYYICSRVLTDILYVLYLDEAVSFFFSFVFVNLQKIVKLIVDLLVLYVLYLFLSQGVKEKEPLSKGPLAVYFGIVFKRYIYKVWIVSNVTAASDVKYFYHFLLLLKAGGIGFG